MHEFRWVIMLVLASWVSPEITAQHRAFYVDNRKGNDQNDGRKAKPWKTIDKLNSLSFQPGDIVYLQGNQTFIGTIRITQSGTKAHPIVITSYGSGKATIDAGNKAGIQVQRAAFITLRGISVRGTGRKKGNTANGIAVENSQQIVVDDIDVSGFQKSGVLINSSSQVRVTRVNVHDNGFSGILVSGRTKTDSRHIYIGHCRAENNPGDPTVLDNHSGNGILVGNCTNVLIEYCSATNNGWDMPRKGNGPVGIWAYEADRVVIQHCLSYRNKTSPGSSDGGGFDFDGGVTNSVIQYCLSYGNQGSGFGIFQYEGASPWYNNTIRYNISENDGMVSTAKAGIFIWNGSRNASQFKNCYVYNNVIYNALGASISYDQESEHQGFCFYNNIFVAKDQFILGRDSGSEFLGNNWWSLARYDDKELKTWMIRTRKEQLNDKLTGLNLDPKFARPGHTTLTSPTQLRSFFTYQLPAASPLRTSGIDLKAVFKIDPGKVDFNQKPVLIKGVGASF